MKVRQRRRFLLLSAMLALAVALPAVSAAAATVDAWGSPTGGNGNALDDAGEATLTASAAPRVVEAWTASGSNASPWAPSVVGGVVYYMHRFHSTTDPDSLVAASTRTGQTLWQVAVSRPDTWFFDDSVTISGHLALMSFQAPTLAGAGAGLMAVDITTHTIAWTTMVGLDSAEDYGWSGHQVYADGSRAYVHLADGTLAAYRLTDGRLQWSVPLANNAYVGLAVGAGRLYVGYGQQPGITAYDTTTGRTLWTGPGQGTPTVAGGRVFTSSYGKVVAVAAAGCGRPTCPALWTRTFQQAADPRYVMLGAADAGTLFVSYQRKPASGVGDDTGFMSRLSAATGAVQWTTSVGAYLSPPVRGGNVVWADTEYRDSAGYIHDQLVGFAATGSATAPLVTIPAAQAGSPQTLAVGGGALFEQTNVYPGLVAYRIPGT